MLSDTMLEGKFVLGDGRQEEGFDHRIGHFRPPENAVRILKCHISLGLEGFVLEKYRLGWPTL
jgi:hypothetical protein